MAARKKRSKADLSRQGRSNRNKGKVYEREIANALVHVYPDAKRGIGQARTGAERPDVIGTSWWIECGAGRSIKIPDKLRQGMSDSFLSPDGRYGGLPTVVFTRTNRGEHIASMERGQFIKLLEELESLRRKKASHGKKARSDKSA